MRFAEEFCSSQLPRWSPFYLAYDGLKTAIKIEHCKAKAQKRVSELDAIFDDLVWQCRRVEKIYLAETSRLSQIQNQIAYAIGGEKDWKSESPAVVSARLAVINGALKYIRKTAANLILFGKTNADATSRILEKLNRVRHIERSEWRYDLPRLGFFSSYEAPSSLWQSFDCARKFDLEMRFDQCGSMRDAVFQQNPANMINLLLPFFRFGSKQRLRAEQWWNLYDMIQIAGFHSDLLDSPEVTRVPDGSDLPSKEAFDNMGYIIADQVLKLDPEVFFQPDKLGPSPFLCAVEHGLLRVASALLQRSKDPLREVLRNLDSNEPGVYQTSPLALAICTGNAAMVDMLLASVSQNDNLNGGTHQLLPPCIGRTAVEAGDITILESILKFGAEVNGADDSGRLVLCVAARRLPEACAMLVEYGVNVNLVEPSSSRTAFCLACIRGDMPLVQMLLSKGADPNIPDSRRWLPIEHASYRGHRKIARLLLSTEVYDGDATMQKAGPLATVPLVQTDRTADSHIPWVHGSPDNFDGHYVWIRLGNNDAKKPINGLQLDESRKSNGTTQRADEVLYKIFVAVQGDRQTRHEWSLPMLESTTNQPWFFKAGSIEDLRLVWQLCSYSREAATGKTVEGSGIVSMGALNKGCRKNRESLVRDTTIPLICSQTSEFVGSITFTYFWSKPHPPPEHLRGPHYWEFGLGVGGHRGSGKNKIMEKKLQIGENTAQSFSTAMSHGASFLEFDIQLTKDVVPVVYHDFLLSESGTDSPLHTLSYDQFKYLSPAQDPRPNRKSRSNSVQSPDYDYLESLRGRMDLTHFNKINGFKSNTRGNFIHERHRSLEEIFQHIPKSVPLNIELKYPMLYEAEKWDMELVAYKTDVFVDTILDKVYEHAEGRMISFVSFCPEICIALSTKQRSYPVFFLSKSSAPKGEIRTAGIQQAIHFAKSWGLPGIVTSSTPYINCPRLVEYVKSAGLTVMSYGLGNGDKESVKIQFDAGLNGVVTDNIRGIREMRELGEPREESDPLRVYP